MANHRIPKAPKCSRVHFQFIADVIRTIDFDTLNDRARVVAEFTDALRATNPRFDRQRFETACQSTRADKRSDRRAA